MPRAAKKQDYEVTVTRILSISTSIEVSATSEEEAEKLAGEIASRGDLTWNVTDDSCEWQEDENDVQVDEVIEA